MTPFRSRRKEALDVLVVEDNPGDVRLLQEVLGTSAAGPRLHNVRDGVEALEYLERAGGADGPRPDLILLDLNLPRLDGRELLARVKQDPRWKSIPVIVLTSSTAPSDVRDAYELHANAYLVKPAELAELEELVRHFEVFWMTSARLP